MRACSVLQRLERTCADAARRKVHHAQQRTVIVRAREQPQIGERVLHLGALEKAHAAIDAIRNRRVEQRVLEHARLRVRSIQHRAVGQRNSVGVDAFDDVDDERRLIEIRRRRKCADRLAFAVRRPQVLAEPQRIVPDQRVRRVEDVSVRAVVLLELDQRDGPLRSGEIALEVLHVRDVRTAKRVDRLIIVADGEHRRIGSGQQFEPRVLQLVRVLELVDEHVREAPLVVSAQAVVVAQHLVASQQQLGEVDRALALAHRVVQRVMLDLPARELVARLDRRRPQSLLLRVRDEVLKLSRREALVVDVVRLVHPLDERELVLRVHDLEQLRQVRLAVMRAQHPVAKPVERADPHAAQIDRRQRRKPQQHLLRRLVRERHGEYRQR